MKAQVRDWNELPEQRMRPGVTRVGVGSDDVSIQIATLRPGMEPNPHSHPYEQIALIISGTGVFHLGDEAHPIGPRSVVTIPGGMLHYVEVVGDEPVVNIDIYAPARADLAPLMEWMLTEAAAS